MIFIIYNDIYWHLMIFIVNLMIFTIFNVFTDIYCLQYLQILNDIYWYLMIFNEYE